MDPCCRRVDPRRGSRESTRPAWIHASTLDPLSCGSTSQGVDAAAWIRRRVPVPAPRSTSPMRERDEGGLRGERGWEREGETYRAPWIHRRRRRAGLAERASPPPCLASPHRAPPRAPRRRPASPRLTERRRARLAEPSAASAPRRRPASPRRAPPGRGGEGARRRGERSGGRRAVGRSVGRGERVVRRERGGVGQGRGREVWCGAEDSQ